ncbi:MAG TPA: flagellar biosynthetic protein FliO [Clostridia bacterium]|nr:flagellar biosynthetic protein FliO [Clostridia bacterium]
MSSRTRKNTRKKRKAITTLPRARTLARASWRQKLNKLLFWLSERMRQAQAARPARKLRVCETASLGDKRFVAVVQFENERFLLGGAAGSVTLIARLGASQAFVSALDACVVPKMPVQFATLQTQKPDTPERVAR